MLPILIILTLFGLLVLLSEIKDRGSFKVFLDPQCLLYTLLILIGWIYHFQPEKKELILVNNNGYNVIKVKEDDKRVTNLWDSDEEGQVFILNNSNRDIFIKNYTYTRNATTWKVDAITIKKNDLIPHHSPIKYIFKEVPKKIKTNDRIRIVYQLSRRR